MGPEYASAESNGEDTRKAHEKKWTTSRRPCDWFGIRTLPACMYAALVVMDVDSEGNENELADLTRRVTANIKVQYAITSDDLRMR
jgi:hypothetical protein